MRRLYGISPVLERQAMQTFQPGSFYRTKAKKLIYLNPLERLELRKKQPTDAPKITNSVPQKGDIPKKPVKRSKGAGKTRVTKLRLLGKPRPKKSMQEKKKKSPSKPRKSPKIAKKGVRLYLQNLRNKQSRGRRKKTVWPGKLNKPEKSASRSLDFATSTSDDATAGVGKGSLKREREDAQEPQAKRTKLAAGPTSSREEMFLVESPPESGSSSEGRSPTKSKSPRKRRMKTGVESLVTAGETIRQTRSGKTEEEFAEWLWSAETKIEDEDDILETDTKAIPPAKMLTSTPKLYPVFTPPVTPTVTPKPSATKLGSSTPKLHLGNQGSLSTPKQHLLSTPKQALSSIRRQGSPVTSSQLGSSPSTTSSGKSRVQRSGVATRSQARSSPKTLSPASWRKMQDKDGMEQMVLDLGQKYFGAVNCDTCGMVYTATHPEDEANHARFHRKYLACTKFNGWKTEEVLEEFPDGRIIVIGPDAPKYAQKKVEEIRELVDRELGFVEGNSLSGKELCKTFLFITNDKKIGGCLIAEGISKGYRVIPDKEPQSIAEESKKAWCCESEPSAALCGISRIWVAGLMRRKKLATRLMDTLRHHFTYGSILDMDDLAFSDPTPDGKLFATTYTKTDSFLVYKYT